MPQIKCQFSLLLFIALTKIGLAGSLYWHRDVNRSAYSVPEFAFLYVLYLLASGSLCGSGAVSKRVSV